MKIRVRMRCPRCKVEGFAAGELNDKSPPQNLMVLACYCKRCGAVVTRVESVKNLRAESGGK